MLTLGKNPIKFHLRKEFKEDLQSRPVEWGYGGLSAFTYYRTYARKKDNGKLETWQECIVRVIEGMFSILKTHSITSGHSWDEKRAHKLAEEAADRLFQFKWTPPGRGLWMMGTPFVYEKGGAALNNCGFVSTENIDAELSKPFAFLMDMSMVGVGVGFDTKGAGKIAAIEPQGSPELVIVEDSREGWVELISCLIDSYLEEGSAPVEPDTSLVRAYGEPIVGFGGVASGPEPLVQGFYAIRDILRARARSENPLLTSVDITDIMNIIGKIVVAGNVRRTAEIAFGEPDDEDFANMKNWEQFGVETGSIAPPELKEINERDYRLQDIARWQSVLESINSDSVVGVGIQCHHQVPWMSQNQVLEGLTYVIDSTKRRGLSVEISEVSFMGRNRLGERQLCAGAYQPLFKVAGKIPVTFWAFHDGLPFPSPVAECGLFDARLQPTVIYDSILTTIQEMV